MSLVTCHECGASVARSDTIFSNNGELLCTRCGSFEQAHAQVERARVEAHARANQQRGLVGFAVGAIQKAAANRQAETDHLEFAAIAAAGPQQLSQVLICSHCGASVPRAKTTLTLEGSPICTPCSATYDAAADRRRLEGSMGAGFAFGVFLSVIGLVLVYGRGRPAEKKGVLIGVLVGGALFLLAFSILTK